MANGGTQIAAAGLAGAVTGLGVGELAGVQELATVIAAAVAAIVSWLLRRWLPA